MTMTSDVEAVRRLLTEHDPAAGGPDGPLRPPTADDMRRRDPAQPTRQSRRSPYRTARRRLVWALATGVVAVAMLLATGVAGGRLTTDESAAATIRGVAGLALTGVDPGRLDPGEVWYQRTLELTRLTVANDGGDYILTFTVRHETWYRGDGAWRRLSTVVGTPRFRSHGDEQAWRAAGAPASVMHVYDADESQPAGTDALAEYRALLALPTDPTALFEHFRAAADAHGDGLEQEMFVLVADTLRSRWPLPPALRGALYNVLSRIPGVRVVTDTTDLDGRPAAAAIIPSTGLWGAMKSENELLYDPVSAEPRGERTTVVRNLTPFGDPAGTVVTSSTIEAQGFTATIGDPTTR